MSDRFRPQSQFDFAILAGQFLLLVLLVRGFQLENAAFARIFVLAFIGFCLQYWLPAPLRQPLFVALSVTGLWLLFGPIGAGWMVGMGLVLIGAAHLRIAFWIRVVIIAALGALLAMMRGDVISGPWPASIWPIFGSMFMFRLMIYLYDLGTSSATFRPWTSLSYFFMLPNACFPLFPVVDYKTFVRSRGTEDQNGVYQRGIDSMFRGLIQLLLYRLVYQHLSVDVTSIETATGAAVYLVRPYLLYLRISGSFHLVVGMLHMFGYDLPRTNLNYFLAASFTDYWRRINIYWKDFVQKLFFNPTYFRLNRRFKGTTALVLATLISFFATWALHSYQWFWIRAEFPIAWQDIVFWSFMGALVLANMIYENRHGRRRSLKKASRRLRDDLSRAGRTMGTFLVICLSWAVWSVQSWGELQLMAERLLAAQPIDAARILGGLILLGVAAIVFDRWETESKLGTVGTRSLRLGGLQLGWPALRVGVGAAALVFAAWAPLVLHFGSGVSTIVDQLRNPLRLSGRDAQALDRGYYEDLTDVARFNPELAELYAERPADWERCWAIHRTGGFPTHETLPSRKVAFKGAMFATNSFSLRDREYTKEKPENTLRVAIHGASHTMGTGVEDEETFENLVEARLNAESDGAGPGYEILNFSVAGHGPLSRLYDIERKVIDYEPDVLVLVALDDIGWSIREFLNGVLGEYELPWPELYQLAEGWGIDPGMDRIVAEARVRPHRAELLAWIYARMVSVASERGMRVYQLVLPRPREESAERLAQVAEQLVVAEKSGMTPLSVLDAYSTAPDISKLWVATWDRHPNALGHRFLADAIYTVLAPHLKEGA